MSKKKLIDMAIAIFAYLIAASFPFNLFIKGEIATWLVPSLQITAQVIFLIFWIVFIPKSELKIKDNHANLKNILLFLPVLLIIPSNYLYVALCPNSYSNSFDYTFALQFVLLFLVVSNEEYIFRIVMLSNLDKVKNNLMKVLISSSVFAICHIGSFLSTFNPADLLVVVYTFGLGMVLGLIYVYGGTAWPCVLIHLFFNLFNGLIFQTLFDSSISILTFILVNIGVALVVSIYLIIIYFVRLRKCVIYNTEEAQI